MMPLNGRTPLSAPRDGCLIMVTPARLSGLLPSLISERMRVPENDCLVLDNGLLLGAPLFLFKVPWLPLHMAAHGLLSTIARHGYRALLRNTFSLSATLLDHHHSAVALLPVTRHYRPVPDSHCMPPGVRPTLTPAALCPRHPDSLLAPVPAPVLAEVLHTRAIWHYKNCRLVPLFSFVPSWQ